MADYEIHIIKIEIEKTSPSTKALGENGPKSVMSYLYNRVVLSTAFILVHGTQLTQLFKNIYTLNQDKVALKIQPNCRKNTSKQLPAFSSKNAANLSTFLSCFQKISVF